MNKSILNILGIGIFIIIVISIILVFTGILPGKTGDIIIILSSLIIAMVILYYLRIKNK
jgi:hypothetical protein